MVSPAQKMWICTVLEAKTNLLTNLCKVLQIRGREEGRNNPYNTYSVRHNLIRYFLISQFVLLTYMILFSEYFVSHYL